MGASDHRPPEKQAIIPAGQACVFNFAFTFLSLTNDFRFFPFYFDSHLSNVKETALKQCEHAKNCF